jgi:hypothetical protein
MPSKNQKLIQGKRQVIEIIMRLDLREEVNRRDNTKGIQNVDKASSVELQRTVDTNSPSETKAKVVLKRRKDAAAKRDAGTQDSESEKSNKDHADAMDDFGKAKDDLLAALEQEQGEDKDKKIESILQKMLDAKSANVFTRDGVDLGIAKDKLKEKLQKSLKAGEEKIKADIKDLETLLGKFSGSEYWDDIKGLLSRMGAGDAAKFMELSPKERKKVMGEIDKLVKEKKEDDTEKEKKEADTEKVEETVKLSIRDAIDAVARGEHKGQNRGIRTILNTMSRRY